MFNPRSLGTSSNPPEPDMHCYMYNGLTQQNDAAWRKIQNDRLNPEYVKLYKKIKAIEENITDLLDHLACDTSLIYNGEYKEGILKEDEWRKWRKYLREYITKLWRDNSHIKRFNY